MSTSPAFGGSRSNSAISKSWPVPRKTAALVFIDPSLAHHPTATINRLLAPHQPSAASAETDHPDVAGWLAAVIGVRVAAVAGQPSRAPGLHGDGFESLDLEGEGTVKDQEQLLRPGGVGLGVVAVARLEHPLPELGRWLPLCRNLECGTAARGGGPHASGRAWFVDRDGIRLGVAGQ